jgi:protein-S-isoprenylcysteine O-methyltransferase Ste14
MVSLPETGIDVKLSLRHRIPPVAVTLVVAALMWLISVLTPALALPEKFRIPCTILLTMLSVFTGFAGVAEFRRANTTVNPLAPENCSQLVESGIFRFTRNPMYLALLMALVGWSVFLGNPWSLVMVLFWLLYIDRYQIRPEEEALKAAFGDAFRQYRSRVRKWL